MENHGEYALDLMVKMNVIVGKQTNLRHGKEETVKQKFVEGILDLNLRRELCRLNEVRSSLKFWELRQHAITWKEGESTPVAGSSEISQASLQGMKYGDCVNP